jgi:hypothetical protein
MPFFGLDVFSLLTTIFWIWMLIDCLFNPRARGGNKVFWFLFILFTQFFGAIVYFFVKCTMRNPAEALAYYVRSFKQAFQPSTTPPQQPPYQSRQQPKSQQPQQPVAYPYSDYAQGYQYQPSQPAAERAQPQPYEPRPASTPEPEYEQTMISYPEMPPQQ